MVIATTTSGELRHASVSGTRGFPQLTRPAGEGDFPFDYWGVAVADRGLANVCARSTAKYGLLLLALPVLWWLSMEPDELKALDRSHYRNWRARKQDLDNYV